MANYPKVHRALHWALALVVTACAGSPAAFSTKYPDNVEDDANALLRRVAAAPPRSEAAIAVGITTAPTRLYAYDLYAKRVLWELPAAPRVAPLLAGDFVLTHETGSIIGRELKTGRKRFAIDAADMTLVGADGDDDNVVFTMSSGMGTYAKSRVTLVTASSKRWERKLEFPAGAPALVGSVVLVPWSNQYLSALTLDAGEEIARLRVRDGVIAHAFVAQGRVYAGSQHGVAQLTSSMISGGLQAGPYLGAPREDLPGRPLFLRDAYSQAPLPAPDSAQNRIRLSWLPEPKGTHQLGVAGGHLYLVFYRFVFALDPQTLALHWVYAHERDLVGARAQATGLMVADVEGEMRFLSAKSGKSAWFEQNGLPSLVVELPTHGGATGAAADTGEPDPTAVRMQLLAAAQDADARLVPMRLLAIKLLARLEDAEATANLLALCDDERTTAPVRKSACTALRQRKTGTEAIREALERHASHLDGTSAPPVGALAKAAASQKDARAVPLLIAHLRDPSTPPQTLAPIVTALADLGDVSAAEPLGAFLSLYHADPIDEHLALALELIPAALVKLQGEQARTLLTATSQDPLGAGTIRDRARRALAQLDDQESAKQQEAEPEEPAVEPPAQAAAEPEAPKPAPPPAHLTADLVKQVLSPVREELQACVKQAQPEERQARLVLVIEDGQLLMVSVTPEKLQSCIEPLVRAQKFPVTRVSKRERISHIVKRY